MTAQLVAVARALVSRYPRSSLARAGAWRADWVYGFGCGGSQPPVLAAVERGGVRLATQRYDGADDVNRARACAAIASVPPLSVFPKTTRT